MTTKYVLNKYSKFPKKEVKKDFKERQALVSKYIELDKLENPNRPRREEFKSKRVLKKAKNNYNWRKTLGDDGIIPYLVKRAIAFPEEYGRTISAYLDLKKKVVNELTPNGNL